MRNPVGHKIRLLYAAIVLTAGVAVVISVIDGSIAGKEVSVALLASLGTFLGALFAFRLNESKDELKRREEQRASLNRALFIIARQGSAVKSYTKFLVPFKTEVERAFNLPAYKPPNYDGLTQSFEEIDFLLEEDKANILMRLTVEDERFHQVFESIRIRNEFYVTEVLPELARHKFQGKAVSDRELFDALGERIFATAVTYSSGMYFLIEESMKSIPLMHNQLHSAAKELFPRMKFILVNTEA